VTVEASVSGLVYIEYISRRPGVSLEAFHAVASQAEWADAYSEDRLLLSIGRTWRLGQEPEYLAVWHTPKRGLDRLDDWERVFKSGEASSFEEPFMLGARIEHAGCYEALREPAAGSKGPYYAEFFDLASGAAREDVSSFFAQRVARHSQLTLNAVLQRIGRLGPDPPGIAFWELPDFAALEEVARELDGVEQPIRLVRAGLYAQFGQETL
jgi:hypothetical protein